MDEVRTMNFRKSATRLWHLLWAVPVACAIACSSGRPDEGQAKADFSTRVPDCEILSVKISEDEVVARSFEIVFRKQGSGLQQKTEIQYIKYDDGWKVSPEPTPLR